MTRFSVVVSPLGNVSQGVSVKNSDGTKVNVAYTQAAWTKLYNAQKAYFDGRGLTTLSLYLDSVNTAFVDADNDYTPAMIDNIILADSSTNGYMLYTGTMFNALVAKVQLPMIIPMLPTMFYLGMPATNSTCQATLSCAMKIPAIPLLTGGNALMIPTKYELVQQQQSQTIDPVADALGLSDVPNLYQQEQPFQ